MPTLIPCHSRTSRPPPIVSEGEPGFRHVELWRRKDARADDVEFLERAWSIAVEADAQPLCEVCDAAAGYIREQPVAGDRKVDCELSQKRC